MRTIYKYVLKLADIQTMPMPRIYKILHVAGQNNRPTIWAEVNSDSGLDNVLFAIIGTGQPIPEKFSGEYIGTAFCDNFVWHVFKENN